MQIKPSEQISVVIPMYNEMGNVDTLIGEVDAALKSHPDYEIVVVDDGSTDGTRERLAELCKSNPHLRFIKHKRNLGQSVGVVTGVRHAKNAWIATLDGDGQNDPADIPNLIKAAEEKSTGRPVLIAGHRVNRKDSGWKRFGSKFANSIRHKVLRDDCPDTGCGIKLFPRDAFLMLPHFNHVHRYLPALFKRAGGVIVNVPVNHRPRVEGVSKYGNWGRLKVGVTDIVGVAWLIRRPCSSEVEE